MSKQVISLETGRQYLLNHVGALKKQVPAGDPFVFLGAFAILNELAHLFDNNNRSKTLKENFGYSSKIAGVVAEAGHRMFNNFSLTQAPHTGYASIYIGYGSMKEDPEPVNKVNLSHKNREHLKIKDGKVTLAAEAFLEDLEGAIHSLFDSIKDDEVASAKVFVKLNETPLIGYGE